RFFGPNPGALIMKRIVTRDSFVLLLAAARLVPGGARDASAPLQPPSSKGAPPANPLQVALLLWYRANTTTSFKVGSQPYGVAFDGANIWKEKFGGRTVSKTRESE